MSFPVADATPGCPVTNCAAPDFSDTAKSKVAAPQRPRPPVPFASKAVQRVDIKTDLGKLLASKDWEDGTVFVLAGSGQRYSSPITVDRRRWRIQFSQTEGPTLMLAPRSASRSGGDNSAFITIRGGGQLDIEHGTFNYDLKDQQSVTPWFLFADGGGFSLSNCRIQVPAAAGTRSRGLIRWAAPATPEKLLPDSEFANYGQITDSLLIGNGVLCSIDLAQRAVLLKNSAFVSRQHLFEVTVGLNEGRSPATFDSQNCTFMAAGTQWSIKSLAAAGSSPQPTRLTHRDCVFAALPFDSNAKAAPLLMNYVGQVAATTQLLWNEESCGYSPDLKAYFATEPALPATSRGSQDFDKEWTQRWGADRVQHPLAGSDGVLFDKNLGASFIQIKQENLVFHKTAKARTSSESGGPIGVQPAALEPPPAPAKTSPATKTRCQNAAQGNILNLECW